MQKKHNAQIAGVWLDILISEVMNMLVNVPERCRAEVDLDCLTYNYELLHQHIGCRYLAVVKADAYGHGATATAPVLEKLGVDWFGVSCLSEALELRSVGITRPILIFGYTCPGYAQSLAQNKITQAVFSAEYAAQLVQNAKDAGVRVDIHLKVDTGMGRLGFNPRYTEDLAAMEKAALQPELHLTGIFTHFSVADEPESAESVEYTQKQFELYQTACNYLTQRNIDIGLRHCCNSAAGVLYPQMRLDMVRMGICMYGLAPSGQMRSILPLRPVMTLRSVVSMVKHVEHNDSVSYGRRFRAQGDTIVATVPVGYADGYPRELGDQAQVLIRGSRAPVIGRVCMDQLMVDVSHIPNVAMGDVVTLVGKDKDEEITWDELADLTNTISYERICAISRRVNRVYLGDGERKEAYTPKSHL